MANWSGAYPWHEGQTSHHLPHSGSGVIVPASYFVGTLQKDEQPHKNEQFATAGSIKHSYGKFAAPYGTVDKSSPSVLKFYPLEGKGEAVDALVKHHGYTPYYAGGNYGKPDLLNKNYNTGHLMIYDPEAGSGGDFGEKQYTDAWRKSHELAHALTYPELNKIYGEGRRIGSLGKQRTTREALRSVHWEHLVAKKQRELLHGLGINISDEDFNREYNTVMHDAVHRAVTGKFTDPQALGFRPHTHVVPLSVALNMVRQAAGEMGLQGEHDILTKTEIKIKLLNALRKALLRVE